MTPDWKIEYRGEVVHFNTVDDVAAYIIRGKDDRELCDVIAAVLEAVSQQTRIEGSCRLDRLADDIDRVALIAGGMADRIKCNP